MRGNNVQHQEEAPPAPAKRRHPNVNWKSTANWPALCDALETCAERDLPAVDKGTQLSIEAGCIPCTTLNSLEQRLGDLPITRDNCFDAKPGLLPSNDPQLLQDMIVNRDHMNTGMDQKGCIQNMSEMSSATHDIYKRDYVSVT
jgi:hypothetical protein